MEEQKNCRRCGTPCNENYKFCPNCGASLDDCKCSQCGAVLIDGAKFCVNCGASVVAEPIDEPVSKSETPVIEDSEVDSAVEEAEFSDEFIEKPVAVKPEIKPVSKPKSNKSVKMNYVVRIIKNASVFVLCTILFALSFCNIITVKTDDSIFGDIGEYEVNVSAVDVMELMSATANLNDADERYSDELVEIRERLNASLQKDYNDKTGKFVLSQKSNDLLSDYLICSMKCYLTGEDVKGAAIYNHVIIGGVFCLLNILFTSAMFIVSVISLVLVALKKKNRVSKFLYAMPVYLFISLLILFIVKTTVGVGAGVAGAMIATLFFEVVAIIATVLLIFFAKKKRVIKNAIPKLVSIATSIIVCACLFAPVFTAKYDLVLQNKTYSKTYSASIDAGGLVIYLAPSEIEDIGDTAEEYELYMRHLESILNGMSDMSSYEFNHQGGEAVTAIIMQLLVYAAGNYQAIGALSAGYYVLLLVFMLFGAFAVWSIVSLFKKDNSMYYLLIPILVLIVTALACSIGWICIMNYHLEDLACSFTVGGGLISAIVISIITLIFTAVFTSVAHNEKRIRRYDEFGDDVFDVGSIE